MHDVKLKASHDVRHLRTCDACGDLGDDRRMIDLSSIGVCSMYHDFCAVQAFAQEQILKLRESELNKFSLSATGVELMKAIVAQLD